MPERWVLALSHLPVLPSVYQARRPSGSRTFRGSMADLCAPLSTLRRYPREYRRITRGPVWFAIPSLQRLSLSTLCRLRRRTDNAFIIDNIRAMVGAMTPPQRHHLPAIIEPAAPVDTYIVPARITDAGGDQAGWRYVEFFTTNINDDHTRRAYARACSGFLGWCENRGLSLTTIRRSTSRHGSKNCCRNMGRPG